MLSNVVLLEGVPTWVIGVSNKVKLCVFSTCILSQSQFYLLYNRHFFFKDAGMRIYPRFCFSKKYAKERALILLVRYKKEICRV
jgi:hypothetical protein